MNKGIFTLSLLLSIPLLSVAQKESYDSEMMTTIGTYVPGMFPHFNAGGNSSVTPGDNSRLTGRVKLLHNGNAFAPEDSIAYIFNNTDRGGSPSLDDIENDEQIYYDESYTYEYNTGGYEKLEHRRQTFTANDVIQILSYRTWLNNMWNNSQQYVYTYDAANVMTSSVLQIWAANKWEDHLPTQLVYDANDNIIEVNSLVQRFKFTYDIYDNVTGMTEELYLMSTQSWRNNRQFSYTYAAGKLESTIEREWIASAWKDIKKISHVYNAHNDIAAKTEQHWTGSGWINIRQNAYAYDVQHLVTSDTLKEWNVSDWNPEVLTSYAYNSFEQLTEMKEQQWTAGSWTHAEGDEWYRFHYQTYFPTGVPGPSQFAGLFTTYPNPATDVVTLQVTWEQPQPFHVSLTDMQGRVLMHCQEAAVRNYQKQVATQSLPAGNYFISVAGNQSVLTKKITIVR